MAAELVLSMRGRALFWQFSSVSGFHTRGGGYCLAFAWLAIGALVITA